MVNYKQKFVIPLIVFCRVFVHLVMTFSFQEFEYWPNMNTAKMLFGLLGNGEDEPVFF